MGFFAWWSQLDFSYLISLLLSAFAALLCITVHESAHGLAAYWMGDPTAKRQRRISLNPLRHIDPVGFLMLVFAHVGWAKPVPVDARHFKKPKLGMAITALAGPVSNLIFAFLSLVAFAWLTLRTVGQPFDYRHTFFYNLCLINCGLAVFNLIPIPPLDGSKVLAALLPERLYWKLMCYERYGMLFLVALVFLGLTNGVVDAGVELVFNGMLRIVGAIFGRF